MKRIAIVGAGLAGLLTAIPLACRGLHVTLYERSAEPGGRARSQVDDGFVFNLGPHALYRNGALHRALLDVGVVPEGGRPDPSGVLLSDAHHILPATVPDIVRTQALGIADKALFVRLVTLPPAPRQRETVTAWLDRCCPRRRVRTSLEAIFRLLSYAADLHRVHMDLVLPMLHHSQRHGVLYVHGGWQVLVDALVQRALEAGVELLTHHRVETLASLDADAIVLAIPPSGVARLVPDWSHATVPVRAACLDLALDIRPDGPTFALDTTVPGYLAVHSATARLAPDGGALVHVLAYTPTGSVPDRAAIEALADRLLPGWRTHCRRVRYLPSMTVCFDHPHRQRPAHRIADNIWLAGDWVGPSGLLGDAVAHSSSAVVQDILNDAR